MRKKECLVVKNWNRANDTNQTKTVSLIQRKLCIVGVLDWLGNAIAVFHNDAINKIFITKKFTAHKLCTTLRLHLSFN